MLYAKEALINLASHVTLLFVPALLLYTESWKKWVFIFVATWLITYFYPPVGWMRPHRHSDIPHNRGGLPE